MQPDRLQPFEDEPRLARIFQDYDKWLSVMGVPKCTALNWAQQAASRRSSSSPKRCTSAARRRHRERLTRRPAVKLVTHLRPHLSGKTTFSSASGRATAGARHLAGHRGMDNYFVNRADTPRDARGEYDFEALEAVDLALFQQHLNQLLAGETILQPVYNFFTGARRWGETLSIGPITSSSSKAFMA
jgi:uridine kinase